MVKKSDEFGITRQLLYEFSEFDILDTYMANGHTICYTCKKDKFCEKHKLKRAKALGNDKDQKLPLHMTNELAMKKNIKLNKATDD